MNAEYIVDASGAFINPAELNRVADATGFLTPPSVIHALRRAALEISRERGLKDQLSAQLDAAMGDGA